MGRDISSALKKAKAMIKEDAKSDTKFLQERERERNNPKNYSGFRNDEFSNMTSFTNGSQQPSYNSVNESYSTDYDDEEFNNALDSMASSLRHDMLPVESDLQYTAEGVAASKMPKEVLAALATNPIDVMVGAKGIKSAPKKVLAETSQPVRENGRVINSNVNAGAIDYSLIKTIVEDCIRKYSSSIVKNIVNESKRLVSNDDELKAIKIGESFKFITSNGDLYEAELKFKKNIKKEG